MIKLLLNSRLASLAFSGVLLIGFGLLLESLDFSFIIKAGLILVTAIVVNEFCRIFSVIGKVSHLPIFIFTLLSVFFINNPTSAIALHAGIWLAAYWLALSSVGDDWSSEKSLIYLGILIGVAQLFDNKSVWLFIPLLLFFFLTGLRSPRSVLMCFVYFAMIQMIYIGVLFVTDSIEKVSELVPAIDLDFSQFNSVPFRFVLPFVLILLLSHFAFLGNYKFRYPNRMKNYTRALGFQALLFGLIMLIASESHFGVYIVLPISILLSIAFSYKWNKPLVFSALLVLIVMCIGSMYLTTAYN